MDTVQLIAKSFVTEYKAKTPAKLKVWGGRGRGFARRVRDSMPPKKKLRTRFSRGAWEVVSADPAPSARQRWPQLIDSWL